MKSTNNQNYNDDIFHYLTGKYSITNEGNYKFVLRDEEKKKSIYYESESVPIADPALDSNFKAIFLNKTERTKNFLNNIYFIPNEMEINKIDFISSDYYEIGKRFNLNSLKPDIVCKGILKNGITILIDIEIQINWKIFLDDKYIEYGSILRISDTNHEVEKKRALSYEKKKKKKKKKKKIIKKKF